MKTIYFTPLLLLFLIPQAFAYNSLQDIIMTAENESLKVNLYFGEDTFKEKRNEIQFEPTLNSANIDFYGDKITLDNARLKVYAEGKAFSIADIPQGIIMYGHYNKELDNYKINIYFATNEGFVKQTATTASKLPDEKTIEKQPHKTKEQYIPDLTIVTEHDFRTYWKDNFDIEIMAYDKNNNARPDLSPFQGTLDGVNVNVVLSLDDEQVATMSGITENGQWKGSHYFVDNLSKPGEYVIDVIASYLGKTVSETSSMFVIGTVSDNGSVHNIPPIANSGVDQLLVGAGVTINLDGSASSDPDGTIVSYSWIQTNGPPTVMINNANTVTPDFDTLGTGETYIFELTVTDNRGATSTDQIKVTT